MHVILNKLLFKQVSCQDVDHRWENAYDRSSDHREEALLD